MNSNAIHCFDSIAQLNQPIRDITGRDLCFSKMWQEDSYKTVHVEYFFSDDSKILIVLYGARVMRPELFRRYLYSKLKKEALNGSI